MTRLTRHFWITIFFTAMSAATVLTWPTWCVAQSVEQVPDFSSDELQGDDTPNLAAVEDRIVAQTNKLRKEHALSAVEPNEHLREAATYFAKYMANSGRYGHQADGHTPAQRASEHGYDYCIVAENIAYRYRSTEFDQEELANKFYTGWRDSPEHRKNMLAPHVTETGVAVVRNDDGVFFSVQMFGRPSSQRIEFTLINQSGESARYVLQGEGFEKSYDLPPRVRRTHRVCRPPNLRLMQTGEEESAIEEITGGDFVVRSTSGGSPKVVRSSGE